jgi:hypothetical protein
MTHVVLRHAPETVLQIDHGGKRWSLRFERGQAWLPRQMALQLIKEGLVVEGGERDPAPRFARNADGSHGRALGVFDPWVSLLEVPQYEEGC